MWGDVDTSSDPRCREIRKCGKCTAPAMIVVHVTQHYNRGMPAGRSYTHRCNACQAQFESLSVWRAMLELFFGGTLSVVGFGMSIWLVTSIIDYGFGETFSNTSLLMRVGFGLLLFFGGLAWSGWTTWKIANLMMNHPVVGQR